MRRDHASVRRVAYPVDRLSTDDAVLYVSRRLAEMTDARDIVVVGQSMGGVVASGGYYISVTANRIVAQPGTITGSIGVLTGKISFNRTLGLVGANSEQVSVGKNTLMGSPLSPYTPEQ